MTLERVMDEIHKWYDQTSKRYSDKIKFELAQNEKDFLLVYLETNRYIAELTVENPGFHPHRFVSFVVLELDKNPQQKPIYSYYDSDKDSINDIIEQLNNGITFITK